MEEAGVPHPTPLSRHVGTGHQLRGWLRGRNRGFANPRCTQREFKWGHKWGHNRGLWDPVVLPSGDLPRPCRVEAEVFHLRGAGRQAGRLDGAAQLRSPGERPECPVPRRQLRAAQLPPQEAWPNTGCVPATHLPRRHLTATHSGGSSSWAWSCKPEPAASAHSKPQGSALFPAQRLHPACGESLRTAQW